MKHNLTLVQLSDEQIALVKEANGLRKQITHGAWVLGSSEGVLLRGVVGNNLVNTNLGQSDNLIGMLRTTNFHTR